MKSRGKWWMVNSKNDPLNQGGGSEQLPQQATSFYCSSAYRSSFGSRGTAQASFSQNVERGSSSCYASTRYAYGTTGSYGSSRSLSERTCSCTTRDRNGRERRKPTQTMMSSERLETARLRMLLALCGCQTRPARALRKPPKPSAAMAAASPEGRVRIWRTKGRMPLSAIRGVYEMGRKLRWPGGPRSGTTGPRWS